MAKYLIILVALLGTPTRAQDAMTGAEFDAYATGRTLSFGTLGDPSYGVEQYSEGGKVIWSPEPGQCVEGVWFEKNGNICFLYENDPEEKCWKIYRTENGIRAIFTTRPGTSAIFESQDNPQPLMCPGPDLLG